MAHAQKPDFVFRRNGWVHLNRRGRQFSRLLADEVYASAVVKLDKSCFEVVWRALATHSIRQFPLHFPSRASPCAITFQLESISQLWCMSCTAKFQISVREWKTKWQLCWKSHQRVVRHCAVVCTIWQTRVEGWQQRCLNERCGSHFFVCRQQLHLNHITAVDGNNSTARLCFVSINTRDFKNKTCCVLTYWRQLLTFHPLLHQYSPRIHKHRIKIISKNKHKT